MSLTPTHAFAVVVFLGLLGVAIVVLRSKARERASGVAAAPTRRPVPANKRPAAAQARLDEIAAAIDNEEYSKAWVPMDYELFDADRRGDVESLKSLLALAKRVETARYQQPGVRATAREFAVRLQEAIAAFVPPDEPLAPGTPVEPPHAVLDVVEERYARGEITREEFQQLMADLV